ncbi:MAG: hypothetical protein HDR08_11515 [Lachnospiraceae bacterium]|nr:hypothetical protein [Lachnospiraceae bacterium]
MLSIENSKVEERMLVLLARFSSDYIYNRLISEIELNCIQYNVDPILCENFQKNKLAKNSWYFAHSYAYADIPVGQKYEFIACKSDNGMIVPNSIMECKATVLCFFSIFKFRPLAYANHGHHEISLIQFQDGIPNIIKELNEFTTESKSLEYKQKICLCSYETLKVNISNWDKYI